MPKATPPSMPERAERGLSLVKHYPRGLVIEPHVHPWAQVLYAVSGGMWVEAGQAALVVPPQRAVWLPPDLPHAIRMLGPVEMRNLYLSADGDGGLGPACLVVEASPLLRQLIAAIAEHEQAGRRDEEYLALAYRLAALELRHAPRLGGRIPLPDESDRRLAALCRAVIAQPSQQIGFERHAADTGASVRTLARLFSRQLGMGFAEWRRQVQLAVALSGLAEGRTVGAIAGELGYRPSSFSDMFHRELGAPPATFLPPK